MAVDERRMTTTEQADSLFSILPTQWKWRVAAPILVPWVQATLALPLAISGWRAGIGPAWALAFFAAIAALTLLEDMSARHSGFAGLATFARRLLRQRPGPPSADALALELHPPPPLAAWRSPLRSLLPLAVVLLTWAAALAATRAPESPALHRFIILTLGFAIVPYVRVLAAHLTHTRPSTRQGAFWVWIAGSIAATVTLWLLVHDVWARAAGIAFFVALYFAVLVAMRLWTGERAWNDVLTNLSRELLEERHDGENYDGLAERIGGKLRHARVAFLVRDDADHLRIAGSYLHAPEAVAQRVPLAGSLTGRVYRERRPVGCNDVGACRDYVPAVNENTRAEIAVPVMYQGEIFAVLDVQSSVYGVYDLPEVRTLEMIARVIGAAIAASRQHNFYEAAARVWEKVGDATDRETANDAAIFDLFAGAAREMLGADLITYYPLTLSGRPRVEPFLSGPFKAPDALRGAPSEETDDVLVPLIVAWRPVFASDLAAEPRLLGKQEPGRPGFVQREGTRSACFLPVGTHQERLGALFLNFLEPVEFDGMTKFTALALAQAYAAPAAQNRYRIGYHHGFGRPEMNLHNVVGRHGFSYGSRSVNKLASELLKQSDGHACGPGAACALLPLVEDMDKLLNELSTLEAARPPDFHAITLSRQVDIYIASLVPPAGNPTPAIRYAIPHQIDSLNPLLKLAIYRVITEGISNALLYAGARNIDVVIEHGDHNTTIRIKNDGARLPPDAFQRKSRYGIYYLLEKFREELGAEGELIAQPAGSLLTLSIPSLP